MKYTIIPEDSIVLIDGIGRIFDFSALIDSSIHAVQWESDTNTGEIEYRGHIPQNETITNIDIFQPVIDAYLEIIRLEEEEEG